MSCQKTNRWNLANDPDRAQRVGRNGGLKSAEQRRRKKLGLPPLPTKHKAYPRPSRAKAKEAK